NKLYSIVTHLDAISLNSHFSSTKDNVQVGHGSGVSVDHQSYAVTGGDSIIDASNSATHLDAISSSSYKPYSIIDARNSATYLDAISSSSYKPYSIIDASNSATHLDAISLTFHSLLSKDDVQMGHRSGDNSSGLVSRNVQVGVAAMDLDPISLNSLSSS